MNTENVLSLGIDIGSTTVKVAILDQDSKLLFADYRRHFADIQGTLADLMEKAMEKLRDRDVSPMITGSGGLTLAGNMKIPFLQEVVAVSTSLQKEFPLTNVAIELARTRRSSTSIPPASTSA